jgi:predicted peptidase
MKKFFFLAVALLIVVSITAQQKIISLYDGPAPGSENWNWNEAVSDKNAWQTKLVYNVSQPSLTVFSPDTDKANGAAVIIAPGGGFHALSITNEGMDVAQWLVQKGITCFVLKYRLIHCQTDDPAAEFNNKLGKKQLEEETATLLPLAIADARQAISYVRTHAAAFHIDPDRIGFIGFSAGGTLAGAVAFGYKKENKPDFFAPIYPYFPSHMHGPVGPDAPPLFTLTATDDFFGFAPHSIDLYNKWIANKKDAEMHLYSKGGHGFGMRKQNLPTDNWIERFYEWLGVQGFLTRKKTEDPALSLFQKKEFVFNGKTLPYRILYPEHYDPNKKYPLLLFLHGAGERGKDNEKQLTHGARLFIREENRKNFPAIIVFPQCPEESFWAVTTIDRTTTPYKINFDYTAEPNWPLTAANELVKQIIREGSVDKSKVYIAGLSMGGMGTFESVYRYPEMYAAALPICGGGDTVHYDKRITKTAFWIFHGAADAVVDVNLSRQMVNRLKNLKAEVKYSEYPEVNHNSWDNAFAEKEFLSWMLLHKRK